MSTDGSQSATVTITVDDVSGANNSTGSAGGSGGSIKCPMSLTPRFTQEEKEILYSLFHQHEEVIDIKFRRKQRSKYSIRDAWEQIVREFNSHPGVSAMRNLKQIQKFWLNARLRKQYPFRSIGQKQSSNNHHHDSDHPQVEQQQLQHIVNHVIKDEPEFHIHNNESSENNEQNESLEEMEMEGGNDPDIDDDPLETAQQQQEQRHQQQQQQQQQQQELQQQVAQAASMHTQQISVDQISAEKLTLNDLLQFKTTRPREEIILQIKHPSDPTGAQITIPSPSRLTIPTHQQQHTMATITTNGYNQQIISEIKPQQITLAQYQAQQQLQQQQQQLAAQQQQQQLAQQAQLAVLQQQQQQHQQQQQVAAATAAAAQQLQQQQQAAQQQAAAAAAAAQQVKMQLHTPTTQFATATPTFTCTTFSALPNTANTGANSLGNNLVAATSNIATLTAAPTLANMHVSNTPNNVTNTTSSINDTYDEKINYFRLKEAELRFKEQQLAHEKKKIELSQIHEQLKHIREIHRLQVEELKMKIRILQEEEKQLRKETSSMGS